MPGGQEVDKSGVAAEPNRNNDEEENLSPMPYSIRGNLNLNAKGETHESRFCGSG